MLTDITADWNSDTTAHDDRLVKYKPSEYINFWLTLKSSLAPKFKYQVFSKSWVGIIDSLDQLVAPEPEAISIHVIARAAFSISVSFA